MRAAAAVDQPSDGQGRRRRDVGQRQLAPIGPEPGQDCHRGGVGHVHRRPGSDPSGGVVSARDRGLNQVASAEDAGERARWAVDSLMGHVAQDRVRRDQQRSPP